jgi:serine protease Do
VRVQTLTPALAQALGTSRDWGVVISDIVAEGPAAKTALRASDLVLSLDGKPMENARQFDVNLYRHRIGEVVQVEVARGERTLAVPVTVVERRDDPSRFMDLVSPERNLIPALGILGLEMTPAVAALLPGVRGPGGVVVAASTQAGLTGEERFLPGDILRKLNGTEIPDLDALRAAASKLRTGTTAVAHVERGAGMMYVTFEVQ